jgi:hypothetical protein
MFTPFENVTPIGTTSAQKETRARSMNSISPGQEPSYFQSLKSFVCSSCGWFQTPNTRLSLNLRLVGLNILLICIPVSVRTRFPLQTHRWSNYRHTSGSFTGLCRSQIPIEIPSFLHVSSGTFWVQLGGRLSMCGAPVSFFAIIPLAQVSHCFRSRLGIIPHTFSSLVLRRMSYHFEWARR